MNGGATTSAADAAHWGVPEVVSWLEASGFGSYQESFSRMGVTGSALLRLSSEELRDRLGIEPLDKRKEILRGVGDLWTSVVLGRAGGCADSPVAAHDTCPSPAGPTPSSVLASPSNTPKAGGCADSPVGTDDQGGPGGDGAAAAGGATAAGDSGTGIVAPAWRWSAGALVEVRGLAASSSPASLANGEIGVVKSFDSAQDRYIIEVFGKRWSVDRRGIVQVGAPPTEANGAAPLPQAEVVEVADAPVAVKKAETKAVLLEVQEAVQAESKEAATPAEGPGPVVRSLGDGAAATAAPSAAAATSSSAVVEAAAEAAPAAPPAAAKRARLAPASKSAAPGAPRFVSVSKFASPAVPRTDPPEAAVEKLVAAAESAGAASVAGLPATTAEAGEDAEASGEEDAEEAAFFNEVVAPFLEDADTEGGGGNDEVVALSDQRTAIVRSMMAGGSSGAASPAKAAVGSATASSPPAASSAMASRGAATVSPASAAPVTVALGGSLPEIFVIDGPDVVEAAKGSSLKGDGQVVSSLKAAYRWFLERRLPTGPTVRNRVWTFVGNLTLRKADEEALGGRAVRTPAGEDLEQSLVQFALRKCKEGAHAWIVSNRLRAGSVNSEEVNDEWVQAHAVRYLFGPDGEFLCEDGFPKGPKVRVLCRFGSACKLPSCQNEHPGEVDLSGVSEVGVSARGRSLGPMAKMSLRSKPDGPAKSPPATCPPPSSGGKPWMPAPKPPTSTLGLTPGAKKSSPGAKKSSSPAPPPGGGGGSKWAPLRPPPAGATPPSGGANGPHPPLGPKAPVAKTPVAKTPVATMPTATKGPGPRPPSFAPPPEMFRSAKRPRN